MSDLEDLIKLIETFRMTSHYSCADDTWYSCPMHPEYRGIQNREHCSCDFFENNARVDEVIAIVHRLEIVPH